MIVLNIYINISLLHLFLFFSPFFYFVFNTLVLHYIIRVNTPLLYYIIIIIGNNCCVICYRLNNGVNNNNNNNNNNVI